MSHKIQGELDRQVSSSPASKLCLAGADPVDLRALLCRDGERPILPKSRIHIRVWHIFLYPHKLKNFCPKVLSNSRDQGLSWQVPQRLGMSIHQDIEAFTHVQQLYCPKVLWYMFIQTKLLYIRARHNIHSHCLRLLSSLSGTLFSRCSI